MNGHKWLNRWVDEWIDVDELIYRRMDAWTDRLIDG